MRKKNGFHPPIRDYGGEPFMFNIVHTTEMNENFRLTLWTGKHLQLTLMSIPVRGSIGEEMHPEVDQFIRIESGRAKVYIGNCQGNLIEKADLDGNDAILIPAGTWHNIVNTGTHPLKLYSLYAPPNHSVGTVHKTQKDAEEEH